MELLRSELAIAEQAVTDSSGAGAEAGAKAEVAAGAAAAAGAEAGTAAGAEAGAAAAAGAGAAAAAGAEAGAEAAAGTGADVATGTLQGSDANGEGLTDASGDSVDSVGKEQEAHAALRTRVTAWLQGRSSAEQVLKSVEGQLRATLQELCGYFDEAYDAKDPTRCERVWRGKGRVWVV